MVYETAFGMDFDPVTGRTMGYRKLTNRKR
jgi:hypothetical protein